ncbi:MAG: hypothetical protein KDK37_10210 [Leptospiraceae bacterium]|nr:hypothetical protein [Leptospiraceae bacterium]
MNHHDVLILCEVALAIAVFAIFRGLFPSLLLDQPNARSSHTSPRSRAGGLLFGGLLILMVAVVSVFPSAGFQSGTDGAKRLFYPGFRNTNETLFFLGLLLAWGNGLLDDFIQVRARYRIVIQFLAVGLGLIVFRDQHPDFNILWFPFLAIGLLYFINVFNFMDGTDGLAATEGIFLCLVLYIAGWNSWLLESLALFLSVFLLWNFPRARIFMGDAGSNLIGYVLGFFLLEAFVEQPWLALLIPAFFVADASLTLLTRIIRRQPFYLAHREHGYQHFAIRYGHRSLLWVLIGVNVSIALLVWIGWRLDFLRWLLVIFTYLGLICFFFRLRAGLPPSKY